MMMVSFLQQHSKVKHQLWIKLYVVKRKSMSKVKESKSKVIESKGLKDLDFGLTSPSTTLNFSGRIGHKIYPLSCPSLDIVDSSLVLVF